MKRDLAEQIVAAAEQMDNILGNLDEISLQMDDEGEKRTLKRAIVDLVVDIHVKVRLPVVHQYPDLHPDKFRDAVRDPR